jgi:succinyl-diaminopimelate desuccinylase
MLAQQMAERGFRVNAEEAAKMRDHIVVNVGEIQGGTMANIVPDKCIAKLTLVLPMGLDQKGAERGVRALIEKAGLSGVAFERFSGEMAGSPTYTNPAEKIVRVVKENAGVILNTVPRTEIAVGPGDGNVYRRMGVQTVVYGPDGTELHSYDESVRINDLVAAARIYAGAAVDFLGVD